MLVQEEVDNDEVNATVVSYQRSTGTGIAKTDGSEEELQITKNALVCDEEIDRFLLPQQKIRLKKIQISPGHFLAAQIKSPEGESIKHEWKQGRIIRWNKTYMSTVPGTGAIDPESAEDGEGENKRLSFREVALIGSRSKHIQGAHCLYLSDKTGTHALAICGIDRKPFPNDKAQIAKPENDRENKIKKRKPGENYSKRYDTIQEANPDVDGWPLPAIYKGKILFYHKHKGYGFITPCDSTDQQDPANIFFRKEQVTIRGPLTDPALNGGEEVRFQIGIQQNHFQNDRHKGKPHATCIYHADGTLVEPYNVTPGIGGPPTLISSNNVIVSTGKRRMPFMEELPPRKYPAVPGPPMGGPSFLTRGMPPRRPLFSGGRPSRPSWMQNRPRAPFQHHPRGTGYRPRPGGYAPNGY